MKLPANVDPMMDIRADARFMALHELVDLHTMTTIERQYALYLAVLYLHENKIAGDIAEVGVWRGGSMLLVASLLAQLGDTERTLWLFDTFNGMTPPGPEDVDWQGDTGARLYKSEFMVAHELQVRETMALSKYPPQRIVTVCGDIRETAKWFLGTLALLRTDTDFYDSTKASLEYLYPSLVSRGILIEDDAGHWMGAGKALDEYFGGSVYMHRIDYSARLVVKP